MDIEQQIQAIKEAIQEMLRSLESEGRDPTDQEQVMMAQALEHAANRITQLRQEQAQQQNAPTNQAQPEQEPLQNGIQIGTPILPSAQLVWILAGSNIDAFVNYLSTIPDPELNNLLRNPAELDRTIAYLHQNLPKGELPVSDGIQKAGLESSNIYGFQYDPKTKKLLVRFQGGPVYAYSGVPQNIFRIFQEGAVPAKTTGSNRYGAWWRGKKPSLGASMHELIKNGGYPYQRLR